MMLSINIVLTDTLTLPFDNEREARVQIDPDTESSGCV